MSTITTQHENGAGRPFAFLPKRRRSRTSPSSKHEIDENDMSYDNDTTAYPPTDDPSTSTAISERHVFPRTLKQSMHIDIPPTAVIPAPGRPTAAPVFIRKKSGELVKPSLKPTSSFAAPSPPPSSSPPSSAASRPRTTSAPATPSASKSVHFDTQLEHVKHFLAGQKPLAVSREGSPVDMDTTSASEAELDTFGISSYPFPSSKSRYGPSNSALSNSAATPVSKSQPQPRMNLKLIPIYVPTTPPNPSAEPWTFNVRVESVRLSTPESSSRPSSSQDAFPHLYGTILVHNKAYSKSIFFRYTLDDWNTVSEVSCKHVHTLPGGTYDRFEYRVKLLGVASTRSPNAMVSNVAARSGSNSTFGSSSSRPSPPSPPPRMEFCVRYNVPNLGEWWDSNEGRNYVVEFKWEPELPSASPLVQLQQANKIVAPQPQRAIQNTGSSPLWQRLARHSIPPSSGSVSPGHISPPPSIGAGSSSTTSHQRSPMHSPSFPPAFPTLGHSDYFNYNKPQAMNIPLRSRYDFGASWREGAKVTGPAVTSPPLSTSIRSPDARTSSLPSVGGNRSPPGTGLMSPTLTHGVFRHTLATPTKKTSSPTRSPERELVKDLEEAGEQSTPSSTTLTLGSPSLTSTDVETVEIPSGLNLELTLSDASASSPAIQVVPPSLPSPSGRRHVRSWIQTSSSEQDMSNSNGDVWAGLGVRKTMSSPAGLAADETTSPVLPKRNYHHRPQLPHYSQSQPSHQHHLTNDGDEEEESEEDGIWFGRRNSIGAGAADGLTTAEEQQQASSSSLTNVAQSDYHILTEAMRSTMLENASRPAHARAPSSVRFKNLGVLGAVSEAGDQEDEDGTSIVEMEMGDSSESSSSASSSTTTSPISSNDALSGMKAPGVSVTPRISTPPVEPSTLPLLNAKLARAILSGTPKSASPSFVGVANIDVDSVPPLNISTALRASPTPPILTSPPSSEGSTTPKAEIPNPMDSQIPEQTSVGLSGINLNSSSYYSLLDQFCFFTGSSSRNSQAYLPTKNQTKQDSASEQTVITETSPERSISRDTYRSSIGIRGNGGGGGGGARSSSADSPPSHVSNNNGSLTHGGNNGFGFNFGFGFDGLGSASVNDTYLSSRYGFPRSLNRSLSDPSDNFMVRSAYGGEQVSGSVG
ncbi:hypothetical protein Clacol_006174 [Clathrus columnatus]|uniref:CBM21 domain-containing protein n=1 Tax=Clathrus columnatus TaxID=1419009 RepID=A0AAV5AG50_9AGAM|nr:hypothetical protein Clacol_006174 [Clathrus columnatus]